MKENVQRAAAWSGVNLNQDEKERWKHRANIIRAMSPVTMCPSSWARRPSTSCGESRAKAPSETPMMLLPPRSATAKPLISSEGKIPTRGGR